MNDSLLLAIETLRSAKNFAVVGLSRSPGKSAHDIPMFMAREGYNIIGVNPFATPAVESVPVVESLLDVPAAIDIVNVFRPSEDTDAIIDAALERNIQRGDVSCIWLQQGITSKHGATKCAAAGITYIEDTCIYVIRRYVSE
ncbi:MAG: CoA-binding protein [Candidatus Kapabacteria bacterium]|nr:CoA-binding protein [Candidatus Kapabacteria bacterium]